jgi:O-antigen/teichoic acid export membrane protein
MFIFPWAFVAILASGIPRVYGNIKLKKIAFARADGDQKPDIEVKKSILVVVKRMMPESIFYCISGQITIWIVSLFGSVNSLANIGAMGRFSVILTFFGVIFGTLIVPRFAKLAPIQSTLRRTLVTILCGSLLLSITVILGTYIFSNELLWVLGSQYKNLNYELVLSIICASISFIQGCFFVLNNSRGWIINPIMYITIIVCSTVLSVLLFDVSSLIGVLYFNIFISSIQAIVLLLYSFYNTYHAKILE